jgi:ubiquinone/menaquinone biosynthesis C-methylase UbiE
MKKVLNVGGNSKAIPLPPQYADFEHLLLDIDPAGQPDVLCDARELSSLEHNQFDMIYCSHNLEHYYKHDAKRVLQGFWDVLKPGGGVHIVVPDILAVVKTMIEKDLDIDDELYQSALGPILISDVIYGYGKQIEESGVEFFAHKNGFTHKSLLKALLNIGFSSIHSSEGSYSITAVGFKENMHPELAKLFQINI